MVGDLSNRDDVSYAEGQGSDAGTRTGGEMSKQMLKTPAAPAA